MANLSVETIELIYNVTMMVIVFLFGITIGSFLNVCIYRLPLGESLVKRNSHCMTCGTEIKRYDLIPVLSWLILKGKCRACGARITPRYMIIESMTGLLFVGVFMRYDVIEYGLYPVMLSLFICGLIVLCFQDIDNREMCVSVLVYTGIIALATQIMAMIKQSNGRALLRLPETDLRDGIYGMLSVSLVLLVFGFVLTPLFYNLFVSEERKELRGVKKNLSTISESDPRYKKLAARKNELENAIKEEGPVYGFGMGDVILMAAGGLMLGLKPTITAGVIAVFLGAIYGIILKSRSDPEKEDSNVFAFGPFLIIGLAIAAFINGYLIDLYLGLFPKG
ncbi:MAG: prepilin peptidase [Huintestinicola sp.]